MASIRSDYQAPGDFRPGDRGQGGREGQAAAAEAKAQQEQPRPRRGQDQRDKAREAELRAAWERLPEAEREAILAAVKAENPGLGRWKNMLEPLCLAALEARMNHAGNGTAAGDGGSNGNGQRLLFPDARPAKAK